MVTFSIKYGLRMHEMEHFRTLGFLFPYLPQVIRPLCQEENLIPPNYIIWHTCSIVACLLTDGASGTTPSGRTLTFVTSISIDAQSVVLTRIIAAR